MSESLRTTTKMCNNSSDEKLPLQNLASFFNCFLDGHIFIYTDKDNLCPPQRLDARKRTLAELEEYIKKGELEYIAKPKIIELHVLDGQLIDCVFDDARVALYDSSKHWERACIRLDIPIVYQKQLLPAGLIVDYYGFEVCENGDLSQVMFGDGIDRPKDFHITHFIVRGCRPGYAFPGYEHLKVL